MKRNETFDGTGDIECWLNKFELGIEFDDWMSKQIKCSKPNDTINGSSIWHLEQPECC